MKSDETNFPDFRKIGEVADVLGITVGTIRQYEARGLILLKRTEAGHRILDDADRERLRTIHQLIKVHGLNIEGICRLMSLLPCWTIHHCTDGEIEKCQAARSHNIPCWSATDRLCVKVEMDECRNCPVYKNAIHCDEIKSLLFPQLRMGGTFWERTSGERNSVQGDGGFGSK